MTTLKLLSAGLIAAAMLTAPAEAHENSLTGRHIVMAHTASASVAGRWIFSDDRIPTPHVGEFAALSHEPGGVCDQGDNGRIC